MRFAVAVKQVPDTMEMSVDENGSLVRAGVPSILNPYDECALSRVLELRREGDEVVVFTMGPPQARQALERCLEMGADRAYLLTDRDFAGADVWATARALTAFIIKFVPDADLYVFGRQAIDGDTGQVPFEVAAQLGVQQFAYVESLSVSHDGFTAVQDYGDVRRTCSVPRGSVVSFGTVDPNGTLVSISDYLSAGSKVVEEVDRVSIGLGLYSVGLKGSMTRIVSTTASSSTASRTWVNVGTPPHSARSTMGTPFGMGIPASPIKKVSLCPSAAMEAASCAFKIPRFFIVDPSLVLVAGLQGHLGLQIALELVDDDRQDDHKALDDHLPELGHAAHHHAVVDDADDESTHDGAADGADTAGHGGTAQHRCGNGFGNTVCQNNAANKPEQCLGRNALCSRIRTAEQHSNQAHNQKGVGEGSHNGSNASGNGLRRLAIFFEKYPYKAVYKPW